MGSPTLLKLDPFQLICAEDKLKLSVSSSVSIAFSSGRVASFDDATTMKLLTSGNVWVDCRRGSRIDVYVSVNDRRLKDPVWTGVLESLGDCIRDAHLWTQLSLMPKLEIPSGCLFNQLSIRIHRDTYSNAPVSRPRGWNLAVVDVIPPESVLCAEFERLQINLDFNTIKSFGEIEWLHKKPPDQPKRNDRYKPHSNYVHQNLNAWYISHAEWPFPTDSEKEELQLQTGLSRKALDRWFVKARQHRGGPRKYTWHDTAIKNGEDIPSRPLGGIETSKQSENSISVGLLTPPSSMTSATLPAPSVCKLASSALHILICGKPRHDQSNVNFVGSTPKNPLSKLAPSIFSPGYIQSVAHHSKLIPTIAHAMINRNWKSPGLRGKLAALGHQDLSDMYDDGQEEAVQSRLQSMIQRRIWAMMQRKLFDPKAAEKLRWETGPTGSKEDPDAEMDEDLLGGGKDDDADSGMMIGEDEFNEFEFSDVATEDSFHNVLADASFLSDDGMLLASTEYEAMWETEEMLFGGGEREIDLSFDENEPMIFGGE